MSTKRKILSTWDPGIPDEVYEPLAGIAELDRRAPDRTFLLEHLHEYDVLLPSLHLQIDREIIERAARGRLRLVYTPSTGLDHLDLDALQEFGVELRSLKTEFGLLETVTSTAELAFALMLAAARRIPMAHNAAMRGHWARDVYRGHQLSGKTLGVLGVGRLGSMMVDFGRGMRMNVIGCDHNPRKRISALEYLEYDAFAAQADVISIHIHLTPDNEHFLNAERIAKMKDGVILVNTSRGKLIDEDALLEALRRGKIGGFGADVIVGEWRDDLDQHPLIQYARDHDHVVIVPHLGGVTHESQALSHLFVVEKLAGIIREWDV